MESANALQGHTTKITVQRWVFTVSQGLFEPEPPEPEPPGPEPPEPEAPEPF